MKLYTWTAAAVIALAIAAPLAAHAGPGNNGGYPKPGIANATNGAMPARSGSLVASLHCNNPHNPDCD
jgi:hypothetical protein